MTYSEKLKDPRWQKKRLEILERDKWTCLDCGAKDKTLHVHHCVYAKGLEPWDYSQSLISLCEDCHPRREHAQQQLLISTSRLKIDNVLALSKVFLDAFGLETSWGNDEITVARYQKECEEMFKDMEPPKQ